MAATPMVFSNPYLQINNRGEILNFELNRSQHILGRDPSLADLSVPDSWQLISRVQASLAFKQYCTKMVTIIIFLTAMAKHQLAIDCISIES